MTVASAKGSQSCAQQMRHFNGEKPIVLGSPTAEGGETHLGSGSVVSAVVHLSVLIITEETGALHIISQ